MNHWIDIEVSRLTQQKDSILGDIRKLEEDFVARVRKLEEHANRMSMAVDRIAKGVEAYKAHTDRASNSEVRKLRKQIAQLEEQLDGAVNGAKKEAANRDQIRKAKTLAIFDAILFNISNWSIDGDTAPDIELASQAILFPAVYERVMMGEQDAYVLEEVPDAALEVVRRGREYVKYFRQLCPLSLVEPGTWERHAATVQEWWVNDALPLLYGARDESWDGDSPYSLAEMIAWRDFPANRALGFPLVFDGMELVERHRDAIREESRIADLNRKALETRLENTLDQ